jgi:hypothetical protein
MIKFIFPITIIVRTHHLHTMETIIKRYSNLPGNADLVFRSLCALLSEQSGKVDWNGFSHQEWALFEKMAVNEGVAAMAYYLLKTKPNDFHLVDFDDHTYKILEDQEAITAFRNAWLFKHLWVLLQALQEKEISVVLLKGADLAHSLYPEPGLRRLTDLDLLVQPERFEQVLSIVNGFGYNEYIPENLPGLNRMLSHHAHLMKEGKIPILLELHWTLISTQAFRYAVPMDWFWQNLDPCEAYEDNLIPATQNNIYTLNPTANLLFLAAHLMLQHGGGQASLHWLLDLQRLVKFRGDKIDWQAITTQAQVFGWSGALGAALEAGEACFATPLPEGLISRLQALKSTNDNLVQLKKEYATTRMLREWKMLKSLNWQGRVKLMLALLIPAPAYIRWRYHPQPAWIWPFCYIYRWFDIARDGWKTIIGMIHLPIKQS